MKALQYYILCKFFSKTQMRYMSQFTRRTQNFHSNNGIRSATGLITSEYVSFIHSFIHYGDLYSAPSRLLLRSAPDPCTAKKSFEARAECVRKNPEEQSLGQRKQYLIYCLS